MFTKDHSYDANNAIPFRQNIESSLGTIANGIVYVASSLCDQKPLIYNNNKKKNDNNNHRLQIQDRVSPNKKRKRSLQDDKFYLNLGLFAGQEFKAGDYITFYGGEYIDPTKVNDNASLQQKLDTSNYVMKINRQRLVDGQDWALLMNRKPDIAITDGYGKLASPSFKYYLWQELPLDVQEQLQIDETSYQLKYQQMMNGGAGLFCNQTRSYLPYFGQWMHQLFTKWGNRAYSIAAKHAMQQLLSVGINCIFVPMYVPHSASDSCSTANNSINRRVIYERNAKLVLKDRCTKCMQQSKPCDSAEMVVLQAITTIKRDTELITYYGSNSRLEHEKFFH